MLKPERQTCSGDEAGKEVLRKGKLAACLWGVLSSIVLRAWESHVQGEGLDGSTQPAKETCPGQSRTGTRQANLTAGNSNQGQK